MESQLCGALGEEQGADLGGHFPALWRDDERNDQALGNGRKTRVWSASVSGQ